MEDMPSRTLTILCYHGIVDDNPRCYNSSGKHLLSSEFRKQMDFVSKNCEVITMRQIEEFARGNVDLPNSAVAITFDDGFANNLLIAHEILEYYELSATLYLATGYVSNSRLMWTDELELLIMEAPPNTPTITIDNRLRLDFQTEKTKAMSFKQIKTILKKLEKQKRIETIDGIKKMLATDISSIRHKALHDFLTWDQVRYMSGSGIWDIGAHTVNHLSLGSISEDEGRVEIEDSINKVIHEVKAVETPLFSYPEGQLYDMPEYAVDFIKNKGLFSAPSAIPGHNLIVDIKTFSFHKLRRFMVGFEGLYFPWRI